MCKNWIWKAGAAVTVYQSVYMRSMSVRSLYGRLKDIRDAADHRCQIGFRDDRSKIDVSTQLAASPV